MISTSHTDVHLTDLKGIHIHKTPMNQLSLEFGWTQVQGLTIYMSPDNATELAALLTRAATGEVAATLVSDRQHKEKLRQHGRTA